MIHSDDDFFDHSAAGAEIGWFDRFYVNVHSPTDGLTLSQGMGRYANAGVVDGFAITVDGTEQRNVRVSSEKASRGPRLEAGPLSAEVVEPFRRWRLALAPNQQGLSYDIEFEADFDPMDAGHIERRARDGTLFDWSHFVQVGRASGRLTIDGRTRELSPDAWFAVRDRSWGIRPGNGAGHRHDWFVGRTGKEALFYLLAESPSGRTSLIAGTVQSAEGERRITQVSRQVDFASEGERFCGVAAELRVEGEDVRDLRVAPPAATVFLRPALYGGWRGVQMGTPRGPLVVEGERTNLANPAERSEVNGLNDHVCAVRSGSADGMGVYEVSYGK